MRRKLYVLAPNDRFNYGDLLFPYIIQYYWRDVVDEFIFLSTTNSDLSKLGGVKTKSLLSLYRLDKEVDNILIVAGGDALCIDWKTILSFLDKKINYISSFDHKFHTRFLPIYIRWKYKPQTLFPYTIGKTEIEGIKHIFYNSLGGTSLIDNNNLLKKEPLCNILRSVDYISVREQATNVILSQHNIDNYLVPDSAILLSDIFKEEYIINKLSSGIKSISDDDYLFFQINLKCLDSDEAFYSELLNSIAYEENIKICLCPIGTAMGHRDDAALKKIEKQLNSDNHILVEKPSIWDIMWLIKKSRLYIGCSLHGTITSMSYGVPFVTYGPNKLKNYIETWADEMVPLFSDKRNIYINIKSQLENPIIHNPSFQKDAVIASFERMKNILES